MSLFPHDDTNLLDGPVRALIAPAQGTGAAPLPTNISDIISMTAPYDAKSPWEDLGATTDAAAYNRDMASEEYTIQQETSAVFSKITGTTRTFTVPIAEITPEHMQMLEEGGALTNIAAGAGKGAQTKVGFGAVESLTRHRVAFIAMRDPGFGDVVTETTGGVTRGPFVALLGYQVTLTATGSGISIAKGALASREVSFTLFPDDTVANADENTGCFLFESAGAIA